MPTTARYLIAALLAFQPACKDGETAAPTTTSSSARPTQSGRYAQVRTALAAAVTGFPTHPAALPRCAPARKGVLILSYNDARQLYARSAPPTVEFASGRMDVASRMFDLEQLEQGKPPPTENPYAWVTEVALFRPATLTAPSIQQCQPTKDPLLKICALEPGLVEGQLVVFDLEGTAVCASTLRADGPYVLALRGSEQPDLPQRRALRDVLGGLFYYPGESPAADAPWRFLALDTVDIRDLTITVDGTQVQRGRESD